MTRTVDARGVMAEGPETDGDGPSSGRGPYLSGPEDETGRDPGHGRRGSRVRSVHDTRATGVLSPRRVPRPGKRGVGVPLDLGRRACLGSPTLRGPEWWTGSRFEGLGYLKRVRPTLPGSIELLGSVSMYPLLSLSPGTLLLKPWTSVRDQEGPNDSGRVPDPFSSPCRTPHSRRQRLKTPHTPTGKRVTVVKVMRGGFSSG